MEKTKIKSFFSKMLFAGAAFGLFPILANAATLTFSPQSGTYSAGSAITVNVYVSSTDQSMNAVSGEVSFPTKFLSVSSVSKSGSIISLWTVDPTFSNSAGTVNFEGIVLNPGFTGSNGKVISITFVAKSTGNANVKFDSGSVLANDGAGTSIPTMFGSAQFVITPASQVPVSAATTTPVITETVVSTSIPAATCTTTPTESPYIINIYGYDINIFIGLAVIALILLILFFIIGRMTAKKYKSKNEMPNIPVNGTINQTAEIKSMANKLAEMKFKYFNEYVHAQLDVLEKDERLKSMQGSSEVIENIKKHIDDYKDFIDKETK